MKHFISILIIGLVALMPFLGQAIEACDYGTLVICLLVGITMCLTSILRNSARIAVSRTDVALLLLFAYVIMRDAQSDGLHMLRIFTLAFSACLYLASRTWNETFQRAVPWGIMLCGVVQSAVAYLQLAEVLHSNHSAFQCTGSFLNPAMLGAVTAVSISVCTGLWHEARPRTRCALAGITVFTIPALICADSRASWLACAVVMVFLLLRHITAGKIWKYVVAIAILAVCAVPLYQYRHTSADARVLIWKISSRLVAEKPLTGHGTDAVKRHYMNLQAEYFDREGSTEEKLIAANNNHAFNEALSMTCSYGLIGLLLALSVFVFFLRETKASGEMVSAVMCIFLFGMFSYPLENITMITITVLALGCTPATLYGGRLSVTGRTVMLCVIALITLLAGYRLHFHERVNRAINELHWDKTEADFVARNFSCFDHEPLLTDRYGKTLFESGAYETAIPVLKRMADMRPSPEVLYDLGECLMKCQRFDEAEECYRKTVCMLPAYITPQYKLMKLYETAGNHLKATKQATYMLEMRLKKETSETRRMKECVKKLLSPTELSRLNHTEPL